MTGCLVTLGEPVLVLDVSQDNLWEWRGKPILVDWLRDNQADANVIYRFEVYAAGDGILRLFEHAPHPETGHTYVDPTTGEVACRCRDVPLVTPPPSEVMGWGEG